MTEKEECEMYKKEDCVNCPDKEKDFCYGSKQSLKRYTRTGRRKNKDLFVSLIDDITELNATINENSNNSYSIRINNVTFVYFPYSYKIVSRKYKLSDEVYAENLINYIKEKI